MLFLFFFGAEAQEVPKRTRTNRTTRTTRTMRTMRMVSLDVYIFSEEFSAIDADVRMARLKREPIVRSQLILS